MVFLNVLLYLWILHCCDIGDKALWIYKETFLGHVTIPECLLVLRSIFSGLRKHELH